MKFYSNSLFYFGKFFSIHAKQTNFDALVKALVSPITSCAMVLITAMTDLIRVINFHKKFSQRILFFVLINFNPSFDEGNHCDVSCEHLDCDTVCIGTPYGPICQCQKGFRHNQ